MVRFISLLIACLLASVLAKADPASDSLIARLARTHHEGVFNGQRVGYTALVKETFLFAGDNTVSGSVITTAYLRDKGQSERPVIFIFNGGPGASSSPLHMEALGPRRLQFDQQTGRFNVIENKYSLLDLADLVFIDPVGTGFTLVPNEDKAKPYWDVRGDATAILSVIREWLKEEGRTNSRVFLCGQSYGTIRATEIAGLAGDIPLSGIIYLSAVLDRSIVADVTGNEMPFILNLPTMSAVAWYHKKVMMGSPLEKVLHDTEQFAQGEYASALLQGSKLSSKSKEQIAIRLSQFTGLSKDFVMRKNLRISSREFQLELLADKDQRIGQLDGKAVGPLHAPDRQPPYDDPSMVQRPSSKGAVGKYFKEVLRFPSATEYTTLNLKVNSQWNWTSVPERIEYWSVAPVLAEVMTQKPDLRLLVGAGCYDLATPFFATKYVLDHAGIPAQRIQYADFQTGHSIFELEDELRKLSEVVRQFIAK